MKYENIATVLIRMYRFVNKTKTLFKVLRDLFIDTKKYITPKQLLTICTIKMK